MKEAKTKSNAGLVHRDVQPRNALLTNRGAILLDFGTAKLRHDIAITSTWEDVGTRRYWAPECLREDRTKWTEKTDVFMLASCIVHLVTGRYLFHDAENYPAFFDNLRRFENSQCGIPELSAFPADCPELLVRALTLMLAADPQDRPSIENLLVALDQDCKGRALRRDARSGFSLTRFIWHLQDGDSIVISDLAERFDRDGVDAVVTVGSLAQLAHKPAYVFVRFVAYLCDWGLAKQKVHGENFFHQYPDEHVVHDNVLFQPCLAAAVVRQALASHEELMDAVKSARRFVDELKSSGSLHHHHYGEFDCVTFGKHHVILSPCMHHEWEQELCIHLGKVPDVWLDSPRERFETWCSSG
jgi:hypothetical protein